MRTIRIWLLLLAATVMAAPLCAEQVGAPEPHWNDVTAAETSTAPLSPAAGDAEKAAEKVTPEAAPIPVGKAEASPEILQGATPEENKHEKAEQQIKAQEQQRVLGVMPTFNVSYISDAVSLTGWQKMRLAFHSATDPVAFGVALGIGGYHEVANDLTGFSWGPKGYFERSGAAYLDAFNGTMIGNGILPALTHQDPRYFRMGHGSVPRRLLYAASTAFICKHDNTGKWEPNYSNVAGNIASGAISNLYYPGSNSGIGLTISNGMIQTAEGSIGAIFEEFWPDISKKLFHKDPTKGKDAN